MTRDCGKDITGARGSSGVRSACFTIGMHEAAIAHRRQQGGKRNIKTQNTRAQIAIRHCYRMTRAEGDVLKRAAVFAKCDLGFRAAVQVIENCSRQSASSQRTKILNINDTGRRDCSRGLNHSHVPESGPAQTSRPKEHYKKRDYTRAPAHSPISDWPHESLSGRLRITDEE